MSDDGITDRPQESHPFTAASDAPGLNDPVSRWGSWAVATEAGWAVAALASFGVTLLSLSVSDSAIGAALSLVPPAFVRAARATAVASRHPLGTEVVSFLYSFLLVFTFALATLAVMFYAALAADPLLDQRGPSPRRAWVALSVGPTLFLVLYFSVWPRHAGPGLPPQGGPL